MRSMSYSVPTYAVAAFTEGRKRAREKEGRKRGSEGERERKRERVLHYLVLGFRRRSGCAEPRKNTQSVTFASPQQGEDV